MRTGKPRLPLASLFAFIAIMVPGIPRPAFAAAPAQPSDFNGDGYADLAIGVPGEGPYVGAVNVLYGSSAGLTAAGDQLWSQGTKGVAGDPHRFDEFGSQLASGDFDGDGHADLAVGAPFEDPRAGVNVFYGSVAGLSSDRNEYWTLDQLVELPPGADYGGDRSVASADFDGDGYFDVALGDTWHDAGDHASGRIAVLHGSPAGLTASGTVLSAPDTAPDDSWADFGAVMVGGDIDGDGRGDLASSLENGAAVFYGTQDGLARAEFWPTSKTEDLTDLSIADFDHDGFGDLAIGIDGIVDVVYGSGDGLTSTGRQRWSPQSPGVAGRGFSFGTALAAGDLNGDHAADLAIAAPAQNVFRDGHKLIGAGSVTVLFGSTSGLTSAHSQFWTQASMGVPSRARKLEFFGLSLAIADYGRSGYGDLAIGVPWDRFHDIRSGSVELLYGRPTGPSARGAQIWSQGRAGVVDIGEGGDLFGDSLTP